MFKIKKVVFILIVLFSSSSIFSCSSKKDPFDPTKYMLSIENPQDGAVISNPIIQVSGKHNFSRDKHMWVLLEDEIGNYYLQDGRVKMDTDTSWYASNIRPKRDIVFIHVVYVDKKGNKKYTKMVKEGKFEGFRDLPENSSLLAKCIIKKI